MNRTLISLVVTALLAGAGNAALAQQGTIAPTAASKAAYAAAQDKAETTYTTATAKCEAAPGAPTAACLWDAEAARIQSLAYAKAIYEGKGTVMTPDSAPQTSAHASDGSTIDSGTADSQSGSAKAAGERSVTRADKTAVDAAAQAQYKQAMAKCDVIPGTTRFTCRERAEQERRDALAQAAADGNNEGRRSRTGRDDLSSSDEPGYRNVSTARGRAR